MCCLTEQFAYCHDNKICPCDSDVKILMSLHNLIDMSNFLDNIIKELLSLKIN